MIFLFSILMYPIFFIISYICGEYIYPTKNGAMLFAFCGAFILSYLYYTIRRRVSQLTQKKLSEKEAKESTLTALMLIDEKKFKSVFDDKDILADNSFTGINEEKLLAFLRKKSENVQIYSIKGITDGAKAFLELLKIDYTIHSTDEIIKKTQKLVLPKVNIHAKTDKYKKLKETITSKTFQNFAIKYGVILLLLSIITPYKLYYIIFGSFLVIYSLILSVAKKISQRNQIPYLRS